MGFHTIIILSYIIPNIYVFLRIGNLFISRSHRLYYTVIYILLFLFYPLNNLLYEHTGGIIRSMVSFMSAYILPFYLYQFLSVLLFDIFLLLNLVFKMVKFRKPGTTRFRILGLSGVLLLTISAVLAGVVNFNTIRTS